MAEQRILDAFFGGAAAPGSTSEYLITYSWANTMIVDDHGRAVVETTQLLWDAQNRAMVLAGHIQDRGTSLLNMRHPRALEVAKVLDTMDLFNTAETRDGIRLYCPIACEDCEMALQCAVASEEQRCRIAKPRQIPNDGAVFF